MSTTMSEAELHDWKAREYERLRPLESLLENCDKERAANMTRALVAEARVAELEALCHLQDAEDGVWVHLHAGDQYFSINLAHDPVARKFCLAYHDSLQPKG